MPLAWTICPHCGRPSLYPNVDIAELQEEQDALHKRYEKAVMDAAKRGVQQMIEELETRVQRSEVVIALSFDQILPIAKSDNVLYATYYDQGATLLTRGSNVLRGQEWQTIRAAAETAFFGDDIKRKIHFGALTLDEEGLNNYGACLVFLKTDLISHRTSAFHENMLLFMKRKGHNYFSKEMVPLGYRSNWAARGRLAIAKLASRVGVSTRSSDLPSLLLSQGKTSTEDEFIEVHVLGPMTVRTFSRVKVIREKRRPSKAKIAALAHWLAKWDVCCEVGA